MTRGLIMFMAGLAGALVLGWYAFPMLLYKSESQPLQFSHAVHAGETVGLTCEDCHVLGDDGRFQGIPAVTKCAECHSAQLGETEHEKVLVEGFINHSKEIPWLVYSRQPDNAYFPHAVHIKLANLQCSECHGTYGESAQVRVYQANRLTGYSRDIWGPNISGISSQSSEGMKMDKCVECHSKHGRRDGCIDCHK